MRNKKLLSTVVASALVATTMAVPVMAADGGRITVPVTTKTPVIRVVVPTSMQIAVNQFEMADAGSQIYSNAFEMENKSEIPVKLNVTSTATVPDTTTLVATKAEATDSTKAGDAWLAVAAQTSAGTYNESGSVDDLTEASDNVTTFAEKKAEQTYYLDQSGTMQYKLLNTNEDASDIEYAQFYELTPQSFTASQETGELKALVEDNDVYHVATASVGNGVALTKIAKGSDTSSLNWNTANTYYIAAQTATAKNGIDGNKLYMYGDGTTATTGGKAGFRYIGKLSGEQETWSDDDLSQISVAYSIVGVQKNAYDELAGATGVLTYGLYKEPAPATSSVPATVTIPASGDITVPVTIGSDNADLTKLETSLYEGDLIAMGGGYGATYSAGTITVGDDVAAFLRGASADDLSAATFTATFGTGENAYEVVFKFAK